MAYARYTTKRKSGCKFVAAGKLLEKVTLGMIGMRIEENICISRLIQAYHRQMHNKSYVESHI